LSLGILINGKGIEMLALRCWLSECGTLLTILETKECDTLLLEAVLALEAPPPSETGREGDKLSVVISGLSSTFVTFCVSVVKEDKLSENLSDKTPVESSSSENIVKDTLDHIVAEVARLELLEKETLAPLRSVATESLVADKSDCLLSDTSEDEAAEAPSLKDSNFWVFAT
jgi:hypothetical protein